MNSIARAICKEAWARLEAADTDDEWVDHFLVWLAWWPAAYLEVTS